MELRDLTRDNFPQEVFSLLDRLEGAGYSAWLVGGAVRDGLLGLPIHDVDVTTSAQPDQIQDLFADVKTLDVGKSFGTIRVLWREGIYEVTTYRAERGYSDGRHPDQVAYSTDIADDLLRRDFTINAMAWHPDRGLLDLYDGRGDLERGILRAVGEADCRIQEDGLRMLRAIRFAARFGLTIDSDLARAIADHRQGLAKISPERCYEELERMLVGNRLGQALDHLAVFGLLPYLLPDLPDLPGRADSSERAGFSERAGSPSTPAGPASPGLSDLSARSDQFGSSAEPGRFAWLEALPAEINLRWAGLLLPAGGEGEGRVRRYLKALHASVDRQKRVGRMAAYAWSVLFGGRALPQSCPEVQVLLGELGPDLEGALTLVAVYEQARAGAGQVREGGGQATTRRQAATQALACYRTVQERQLPWRLKDLAIDGRDLQALGVSEGREIGQLLEDLLQQVIWGKVPNEKAALEAEVRAALQAQEL